MRKATQIQYVPAFDGEASSVLDYKQRVMLRSGSTDISMGKRATLLILHMGATARQVCLYTGGDPLMEGDDVVTVTQALRDYFQPDVSGQVYDIRKY